MDTGRLTGSWVNQAGPHLGVKGLAQVDGSSPHAAAPPVNAAVGVGAQEVPQQGQHFLLHHLGLARVELFHEFWSETERQSDLQNNFWRTRFKSKVLKYTYLRPFRQDPPLLCHLKIELWCRMVGGEVCYLLWEQRESIKENYTLKLTLKFPLKQKYVKTAQNEYPDVM